MTFRTLALPLAIAVTAGPLSAASAYDRPEIAPEGTATTRYCMRVEAVTGSRLEHVVCWTRSQWADQGVDVDRDWAKEGVRVLD